MALRVLTRLTSYEKECLAALIDKNSVILQKVKGRFSSVRRRKAWEKVTEQFNTSFSYVNPRTTTQLRRTWKMMKDRAKRAERQRARKNVTKCGSPKYVTLTAMAMGLIKAKPECANNQLHNSASSSDATVKFQESHTEPDTPASLENSTTFPASSDPSASESPLPTLYALPSGTSTPVPRSLTPPLVPPLLQPLPLPPSLTSAPPLSTLGSSHVPPSPTPTAVPPSLKPLPVPPSLTSTPSPPSPKPLPVPPSVTSTPPLSTLTTSFVPSVAVPPSLSIAPYVLPTLLPPLISASLTPAPATLTSVTPVPAVCSHISSPITSPTSPDIEPFPPSTTSPGQQDAGGSGGKKRKHLSPEGKHCKRMRQHEELSYQLLELVHDSSVVVLKVGQAVQDVCKIISKQAARLTKRTLMVYQAISNTIDQN